MSKDASQKTKKHEAPDLARATPFQKFFFLKPTFGVLLALVLIVGGMITYPGMVKESIPDLEIAQALVITEWPGADPETIEQSVTDKIEKKIKSLKNLKRYRSASFNSYSIIAVEFNADADMGESMQLLRDKVKDAEPDLPQAVKKSKIQEVSVNDAPILNISIYGNLDEALLGKAAEDIRDALERVPGVNQIRLSGKRKEVVLIQLNLSRLYALGISPSVVKQEIESASIDMPWDKLENDDYGATLRLYGKFREIRDIEDLPVMRMPSGRAVRLKEIAEVRRDLEKIKNMASLSWKGDKFAPCIDISVTKNPGADTIRTVDALLENLEELRNGPRWPYNMKHRIIYQQSEDIWSKLLDVFNNGWQAMLAVFIVLFFMLAWREALIAGISIPITFCGALVLLQVFGQTLNELVIIGMLLALGLLVDVFILMMEGIHEGIYMEGLSFGRAALSTVKKYSVAAFSGQMTTILAMIPLMVIGGLDGKFIRVIPITAIICLVISYIVALFVDIPCARFLFRSKKKKVKKTTMDVLTEKAAGRLCGWSLKNTVRSRSTALAWVTGAILLFILSIMAFTMLPMEMYPKNDGRKLGLTVELSPETTLQSAAVCADELGEILRKKDYLESVTKLTGQKTPYARNSIAEELFPNEDSYIVSFSCMFTPLDKREKYAFEYLPELRADLKSVLDKYPGSSLVTTPETGGSSTEDPVQISITGNDLSRLRKITGQIKESLRGIPGATDVRDNLGPPRSNVKLLPRREALDFYNIREDVLAEQIRFSMANDEVGKFVIGGTEDDLEIRLGTSWPSRNGSPGGPTSIPEMVMLRGFRPDGKTAPLFSLVSMEIKGAPLSITRKNGRRSVTVMSKTEGRTAADIFSDIKPLLEGMKEKWPEEYRYDFGGEAENSSETFASAGKMFLLAVFLVFALLVIQFGSFTQPFIIMLSIPIAITGSFAGFFISWTPFSFPAMIGLISLAGIVVNDSIVMIETMNEYHKKGMSIKDAAAHGGADRLRPILSTTITTVVGLTPLALSNPMWMPLCSAIIFGLSFATLSAMLIIPSLYILLTPDKPYADECLE